MSAIRATVLRGAGVVTACVLMVAQGCGNPFLALEDYQRDILFGALAAALLAQPAPDGGVGQPIPGVDGLNCWDVNGNGTDDIEEDVNGDGVFDALDCQGPAGINDGINCWDLNGNGLADDGEDTNADGFVYVLDCRGSAGADGTDCTNGSSGSPG